MRPYEWMAEYTPQTIWIDGKGKTVWLAEVSGALGGGLYLVALYFDSFWGMFISWLIITVLKGGFHLAHLGRPSKAWRLALKVKSSWVARGFIFMALFIGFGAIQLAISYWLPGTGFEFGLKALTAILAVLVAGYTGFVLNYINGIPFWNSGLLPLVFVVYGALGGLAIFIIIGVLGGNVDTMAALGATRVILIINALLVALYLWSAAYMGPAGKHSVRRIIYGRAGVPLWFGVVLCGVVIPLGITIPSYFVGHIQTPWLIISVACVIVGAISLNYCLLKGALYSPLVPTS
jgi:formate-dependent nitrite reductase membrane component NrfD